MAIAKMKRLSLIATRDQSEELTKDLLWLKCVEVIKGGDAENNPVYDGTMDTVDVSGDIASFESQRDRLYRAISGLEKFSKKKEKSNLSRTDLENLAEGEEAVEATLTGYEELLRHIDNLKSEKNQAETEIASLLPWIDLDVPLSFGGTKSTIFERGTIDLQIEPNEFREEMESVDCVVDFIGESRDKRFITVLYHTDSEWDVKEKLSGFAFAEISFPGYSGMAKDELSNVQKRKKSIEKALEKALDELPGYAEKLSELRNMYDYTSAKISELNVKRELLETDSTVILSGWVPEKKAEKLKKTLEKYTCYYELSDPTETDDVPVELENKPWVTPFESVIGLYSYPNYRGYDPTAIMSIFYFIIFGLMLCDFGYGLLLTVSCFVAVKLMKPKKGMRDLLNLFGICGISTMIAGALFGGYFGDLPKAFWQNMLGKTGLDNLAIWFDPTKNPMPFLYLSLAVGVIHVLTGIAIKGYMMIKRHEIFGAFADCFSWLFLFLGAGIYLGADFVYPAAKNVGLYILIASVLVIILFSARDQKNPIMRFLKGLLGLYDLVGYASDILSYSRILALCLAAAVVSQVINIMSTMAGGTFVGYILFFIVMLLGHTLNIALNLLGSFVHTSRLQYIEFFGKFYEDGGRPFAPAGVETKYANIILND